MEVSYYEIPVYDTVILPIVYMVVAGIIALVCLVTYLSCRNILKETAVEALRIEMPKIKKTKFDITTKGIFKKASISTRWNLRDIGRNKGRSIMAVVGITGCTMLLVCAFGLLDTMNSYLDWKFGKISNFEYKLSLSSDYTDEEFENLTNKYGNETCETLGIEVKIDGKKETNTLVVNDAKEYLKYTNHEREYMELNDDGIYLTEKLAQKYSLKIGDKITWHAFGQNEWQTSKIVGINRDPQSQNFNMTRKYYESLGLEYRADVIYTKEKLEKTEGIEGVDIAQNIEGLKDGMESMLETTKSVVVLLLLASALLGFVVIYNLGVLSFSEKQYQFATLKVLGFKSKNIRQIFIKQNLWLAVIGIIAGLPFGFALVDYIFKAALGDNYDFNAYIGWTSYLIAIIGSFAVAIFVNRILAKKVNSIDMVSSLKGNE